MASAKFLEELYETIYLPFPNSLGRRSGLCDLLAHITNQIPSQFAVVLITGDGDDFEANWAPKITRQVGRHALALSDVWVGDYFPYRIDEENYFVFDYADYPEDRAKLLSILNLRTHDIPLALDLGSFEVIGETLLVSKDVFELNRERYSKKRVATILKEAFETDDLEIVDTNTTLHHIDTMFRVVYDLAFYNPSAVPDALIAKLRDRLEPEWKFCPIDFELSGRLNDDSEGEVDCYVGNVFDFLVMDHDLIFPLTSEADVVALRAIQAAFVDRGHQFRTTELRHPDLHHLYSLGGGLFCVAGVC